MRNFEAIYESMKAHGMKLPAERVSFRVKEAKEDLCASMVYFIERQGKKVLWLPVYDRVADWLENNDGKGLLMYGNCGLGKTILGMYAIPAILLSRARLVTRCYTAREMTERPDEVLSKRIVYIDDVGTEEQSVKYGDRRDVFPEVMDNAEKTGNLVIASTNLDTEEIRVRYGDRVIDRIRSTMTTIPFNGKSMRR